MKATVYLRANMKCYPIFYVSFPTRMQFGAAGVHKNVQSGTRHHYKRCSKSQTLLYGVNQFIFVLSIFIVFHIRW
jgi:hypothetical protein